MSHCPDLWNVLHDGTIVAVTGQVPGEVKLEIEADYLRDRFNDEGGLFALMLRDCSRLVFKPWEEGQTTISRLDELGALALWILSAEEVEGQCAVSCTRNVANGAGGVLEVVATDAVLSLDTGRVVSRDEIEAIADAYWTEWSSRSPE
jgi:hypothetical protein